MAQTCPRCGKEELRQVTPGFYECLAEVIVGVVPPGAHGNPVPIPVNQPCGHRFHVAGAGYAPPCSCGRDSIGACRDCDRRLCGLHGSSSGEFLCRACIDARKKKAEVDERTEFEREVSVVRKRAIVSSSRPAPRISSFDLGAVLGRLREDGEQSGHPNLVGLMWADRHSAREPGTEWQLVRHFTVPVNKTRRVSRPLRGDVWESYVALEDRWLAYAHWEEARRLCDVRIFKPEGLVELWTHLSNRAGGSHLHDIRWADLAVLPALPTGESRRVRLDFGKPLYPQLCDHQVEIGVENWLGLAWTDPEDRRCTVVDDVLAQGNVVSLPTVYRTIVIEKEREGKVVDMEMSRHDAVKIRINEIGREIGESSTIGDFTWSMAGP